MTLAQCLNEIEQRGSGYTVELMRYDGNERTVDEFKRHEGLEILNTEATLNWAEGSHLHDGERTGEIVLQSVVDVNGSSEHPHNVIVVRYHQSRD